MAAKASKGRARGHIRRRGNSYQVLMYAGIDPITGRMFYLTESTTERAEAERILNRMRAEVEAQQNARTRATLGTALDAWLRVHEVEMNTRLGYEGYIKNHIAPALGSVPISKITAKVLEEFYAELRRCRVRCNGSPRIDHRTDGPHECRTVRHRRPPGRPPVAGRWLLSPRLQAVPLCCHRMLAPRVSTSVEGDDSAHIHFAISGALAAAVRWEWIKSNPALVAKKPRQPTPRPNPPTVDEASRIVNTAWDQDEDWGTLVWLVMVTGVRRAELLALRWTDVDLRRGMLSITRNYVRAGGRAFEKDTKTHQMRRIAVDDTTVEILSELRRRYDDMAKQLGVRARDDAFLFSHKPERDIPYDPDGVSHRYIDMCASLGIDSHLHALRHYSATELLSAGVDIRTVAGRLGHGGGGTTTLRVYAAWVTESDKKAAKILAGKVARPKKP